jgi:hypothetical protein
MGTKLVTIVGLMTEQDSPTEPPVRPPGIPTFPIAWPDYPWVGNPIYIPGYPGGSPGPGWGQHPKPPIQPGEPPQPTFPIAYPPGNWPTHPIYLPGYPGGAPPWWGTRPPTQPPTEPPAVSGGGMPGQLPASDPSGSGWVYAFVPGYGWMWAKVPEKPTEPPVEPPVEPPTA